MNKNPYRPVFSRARNRLIAVEETAGASAKTSRGETIRTAPRGVFRRRSRQARHHAGRRHRSWVPGRVHRRACRLRTVCHRSISTGSAMP
ncbi:ESPR-type extended signal peptide-containing protein [Burkholderia aenigmatica]|uniref:ESPR-type extended signal peptide-containing protein n=1 Tax=Burkholderia TaxID=32008 RepID=UPI001582543E